MKIRSTRALLLAPAFAWAALALPAGAQSAASPSSPPATVAAAPSPAAPDAAQNAQNAAEVPPMAAPPAPLPAAAAGDAQYAATGLPASLLPNPNEVRVYVQNLQGPDAEQIAGLLEQSLFQSGRVVVTENPSNAGAVLKGVIYRRPVPAAKTSRSRSARRRRSARAAASALATPPSDGASTGANAGVSYVNPNDIPTSAAVGGSAGSAMGQSSYSAAPNGGDFGDVDGLVSNLGAPSLSSLLNPGLTDLTKYQYRLDLELVDQEGDLIWISGRGIDAPNFASANQAVAASLQPMLDLLAKSAKPVAAAANAAPSPTAAR